MDARTLNKGDIGAGAPVGPKQRTLGSQKHRVAEETPQDLSGGGHNCHRYVIASPRSRVLGKCSNLHVFDVPVPREEHIVHVVRSSLVPEVVRRRMIPRANGWSPVDGVVGIHQATSAQ
jgi:hypothetical protein